MRSFSALQFVRNSVPTTIRKLWLPYSLASFLILAGFGWSLPNPYQDRSFHADENAAVWAVRQIHLPDLNPHWFPWGTGMFYQTYAAAFVIKHSGIFHLGDNQVLVAGRLVVFFSALGAITALYFLARNLFDEWTGLLAATILAVTPGFVINSHYFKTDVPMTFWMVVTLLVAYQLMSTGKSKYVLLLGFLVGYTTSMKYSGATLFPAACVAIASSSRRFRKSYSWIFYLGCTGLGFLFGEPYALLRFSDILAAMRWVASINREGTPYIAGRPPAWLDYPLNVMPYSATLPLLIAAAVALIWILFKARRMFLPVIVFLLAYYPLLATDNVRLVRYTVPLLPLFALFVSFLVREMRQRRAGRMLALPAASLLIAYVFVFSLSYIRAMANTDPRVQASHWIQEQISRDQPIPVLSTHYTNVPQIEMIGYKKLDVPYSIPVLKNSQSPYLIISEFSTSYYEQALPHYPQQRQFFSYVGDKYSRLAQFENSQKLFGVNSKEGSTLPMDWLYPNPKITIWIRRGQNS
jgi:4-amino-4-deoxy-L-arabinose transferase-like glycosyltransferase